MKRCNGFILTDTIVTQLNKERITVSNMSTDVSSPHLHTKDTLMVVCLLFHT
jgi:hypothetical protein